MHGAEKYTQLQQSIRTTVRQQRESTSGVFIRPEDLGVLVVSPLHSANNALGSATFHSDW
jgi:hypothetical protein